MKIGNYIISEWLIYDSNHWGRHIYNTGYGDPYISIITKNNGVYFYFSTYNPFIDQYNLMFPYIHSVRFGSELFPSAEAAKDRVDLFLQKLIKLKAFL